MRFPARLLLTGAAAFAIASCYSDRSLAPAGAPTVAGNPALKALAVAQTFDLVIPAAGGAVDVAGVYELNFPAGAVCDPNAAATQAGYESQSWDAPCTATTSDIALQATVKYSNGKLYADFTPALRFAPDKNVTISTSVLAPLIRYYNNAGIRKGWTIEYAPAIDAPGVADALGDPSLRTRVHASRGTIIRRIKHFSSYMALLGDGWVPCDPNDGDPRCVWVEDEDEE